MMGDEEEMTEKRGGSSVRKPELREAVINDIKSYHARETHYGRADVIHRVYLPGKLWFCNSILKLCST